MEILTGWLKGWRVKPPKFDATTGEERHPSVVAITIEVPTSGSAIEVLRTITEGGEVCELGLAAVQTSLELRAVLATQAELEGGGA